MSYTIEINEQQRLALLDLVRAADQSVIGPTADSDAPLEFWVDMLDDLPGVEEGSPGIIHGFCL